MADREALMEHYRRLSDEDLRYFATHEVAGLVPEAVEVLRQELKLRNILPDPDAVLDAQTRRLSSEEFERMVSRFRQQPCPSCGRSDEPLNGASVNRAGTVDLIAGCTTCLEKQLKDVQNASLGIGFFFSPVTAVSASSQNDDALQELRSGQPTRALREYVWFHRGELAHLLK